MLISGFLQGSHGEKILDVFEVFLGIFKKTKEKEGQGMFYHKLCKRAPEHLSRKALNGTSLMARARNQGITNRVF